MIARPNASIVLPFLLTALMGCHSAAPTTPAAQTMSAGAKLGQRKAVTQSLTLLPLKIAASERKC
jgi:hypothetical protein